MMVVLVSGGLLSAQVSAQCGAPGAGSCCHANSTPHCADEACCTFICVSDPFCCNVEWDGICADSANTACAVCLAIIHVPSPGITTIQQAIDTVADGGEVIVDAGTYSEAINFNGKQFHLRSVYGPAATIIDAAGLNASAVTVVSGEGPGTIIDGFTITGGAGNLVDGFVRGGGMYISNGSAPIIKNCIIKNNVADSGGGLYIHNSSPTIIDSAIDANAADVGAGMSIAAGSSPNIINTVITGNWTTALGGGVENADSNPTFIDCVFDGNFAGFDGGAMFTIDGGPIFENCLFLANIATWDGGVLFGFDSSPTFIDCVVDGNFAGFDGGALYISGTLPGSETTITNSVFDANSGRNGGAIYNVASSPIIDHCLFAGNSANFGGAIYSHFNSQPRIADSAFEGNSAVNQGGAMSNFNNSHAEVKNTAFRSNTAGTQGGGMYNALDSHADIENCIFEGNAATTGGGIFNSSSHPEVWSSVFEGNTAGSGAAIANIGSQPLIVNSIFRSNTASSSGGGIWNNIASTPELAGSHFCANLPGHVEGTIDDLGGNDFGNLCPYWDPAPGQPGMNQAIRALAVAGDDIFAAGSFTTAGGKTVNRVARWDAAGQAWSALASSGQTGVNQRIDALLFYSGQLFAGGHFTTAGNQTVNHIARWDGSAWHPLSSGAQIGVNGPVTSLAVYNGNLYAGGQFTTAGGQTVNRIARWDGSAWHPLSAGSPVGLNGSVLAMTVHNDHLILGGTFTTAGGQIVNRIARWTGSSWQAMSSNGQTGMNGSVHALSPWGSSLIAGGAFTTAGGFLVNHITIWPENEAMWHPIVVGGQIGFDGPVMALAESGGYPVAAGDFITGGGQVLNRIGMWDVTGPAGGAWRRLTSGGEIGVKDTVRALAAHGSGGFIVGGAFTSAGGESVGRIATWIHTVETPCPGDLTGNGSVGVFDLLALIGMWGPCPAPPAACIADLTGNGSIGVFDLLALIGMWGPCP